MRRFQNISQLIALHLGMISLTSQLIYLKIRPISLKPRTVSLKARLISLKKWAPDEWNVMVEFKTDHYLKWI